LHVAAVLDQIRHLEQAEFGNHARHHGRGQRHVGGAEQELLQQLLVGAELARAEHDDLRLVAELLVGVAGEFVGRKLEQRARFADMAELDFGLGVRCRDAADEIAARQTMSLRMACPPLVLPFFAISYDGVSPQAEWRIFGQS
jgi:hypothetical protein